MGNPPVDRVARRVLFRGPLFYAFVLGCAVSVWSSDRLTARLIVDGAVSFAFVPAFQLLALAVVRRVWLPALPWREIVDRFFAANTPWLIALVAFMAVRCVISPTTAAQFTINRLAAGSAVVLAWSAYVDVGLFRRGFGLSPTTALRAAGLQRAIAWTLSILYFFGIAIWPEIVTRLRG